MEEDNKWDWGIILMQENEITMKRSEIRFATGDILRKEMLMDLYGYPRVAVETYYAMYSDGILYGLGWRENKDGTHQIGQGALKFHGDIYFLPECIQVEETLKEKIAIDGKYRLFFKKQDVDKKSNNHQVYSLGLEAVLPSGAEAARQDGFYYAYVECRPGKILRRIRDKDRMYGLFAANDGYGFQIPNSALRDLSVKIKEKESRHPLDYMLLKDICAGKSLSLSFARVYLEEAKICCQEEDFAESMHIMKKLIEACEVLKPDIGYCACKDGDSPLKPPDFEVHGGRLL